MARAVHLAWCRARAMEYIDLNQPMQAVTSMTIDLTKDDSTRTRYDMERATDGTRMLAEGADAETIRIWIESFV